MTAVRTEQYQHLGPSYSPHCLNLDQAQGSPGSRTIRRSRRLRESRAPPTDAIEQDLDLVPVGDILLNRERGSSHKAYEYYILLTLLPGTSLPEQVTCSKQESCHFPKVLIWGTYTSPCSSVPLSCTILPPAANISIITLCPWEDGRVWVDSSKASGSLGALAMSTPTSGSEAASAPSERTTSPGARNKQEAILLSYSSGGLLMGPWAR